MAQPRSGAAPHSGAAQPGAAQPGAAQPGAAQPGASPFDALPAKIDLPEMEHRISRWWQDERIFGRALEQTADGEPWVFYEGPPTANGHPGTHHVEARVFKDLFPRFKTMKGHSVPRRAGWDCHGLPVELAVEKELGLSGKPDIEKYGVAEFNARCRESVQRYVGEFEAVTERMGYWIDLEHPYRTMSPQYVDSVWWALQRIFRNGHLFQDYRVAPYCPRCGTTLSDHELAQGYETVTDPSIYVRFPLRDELAGYAGAELLVWTTTPWTLVSNTAVAVHPEATYAVVRSEQGTFVVAESLIEAVFGEQAPEKLATMPGSELVGLHYRRPFELVDIPGAHFVVPADYVTMDDGTGLVHQAPAFGADDLAVCKANGLPVVNPIEPDGHFAGSIELVGGKFFKDADPLLTEDLKQRGLLFHAMQYEHSYPHCWRCHTPLMYYAQLAWYIRTTAMRDALKRENDATNWYPEHVKHGRYGDWLDNNVDWALSRTRYWGTPLPIWRCAAEHLTVPGSRAELGGLAGSDLSELDPHRPYIDEITFPCPDCGSTAERVPEVIDAWFDSGSMPFAQLGYPHVPGSVERFERSYPADYICEAIDQTRGWFYTLMAIGTLVFDRSSYRNVVCLGHILAEDGRKMSKHLGNILEPLPLMDRHGADTVRWFMACSGSPWSPRRIGHGPLEEITRKILMTYWNVASFFTLYASHAEWSPSSASPPPERPIMDRWALAEVHALAQETDRRLEEYDTAGAGRLLMDFIDDLSNWYVRRSRQRFWAADQNALVTLYECLDVVTRLLAPVVPFITEEVWQRVVRLGDPDAPESVHLAAWPQPGPTDPVLSEQMHSARALVEAGRAARKASDVRIRQPLERALIGLPEGTELPPELLDDVAAELNIKSLQPLSSAGDVVDVSVKPNFRALGKRFGKQTQQVANAINAADPREIADGVRNAGQAAITFDGEPLVLSPDEVALTEVPRTGWTVESQRGTTIALDTEISEELAAEGVARDAVRVVQQARRDAGLDVSDRIALTISGPAETLASVRAFRDSLATETLADSVQFTDAELDGFAGTVGAGEKIEVAVAKV